VGNFFPATRITSGGCFLPLREKEMVSYGHPTLYADEVEGMSYMKQEVCHSLGKFKVCNPGRVQAETMISR
jgi:hypothetical protein